MKYSSPASFRQALEDRLRTQYPPQRIPRVRKMIVFERFMARMDERWILKGGYALQLRTEKARTTQDIDLLALQIAPDRIAEDLLELLHQDFDDHFDFYLERTNQDRFLGNAIRFHVTARLAGRVFESFQLDIGLDDAIIDPVDYLVPPAYLAFAEIPTALIPCYPITQHLAKKLHALVRPRLVETSRVKDFVDILLFACLKSDLHADHLMAAIQAVFQARGDQIPVELAHIPANWRPKYNQSTKNFDLPFTQFDEAVWAARKFINPIFNRTAQGIWDPILWEWTNKS